MNKLESPSTSARSSKPTVCLESVTIRLAGDSGDGMQLVGMQFSDTSALIGNDISTLPDYPSEIRAPAGTVAGVSGFQIQFASSDIFTPGDALDALVAMNPAALRSNLGFVKRGGLVIANVDAFNPINIEKAGYAASPLDDPAVASAYRIVRVPIDSLNAAAVKDSGLSTKQAARCRNFFALGVIYWLYSRPLEPTLEYIQKKFGAKLPAVAYANAAALKAGFNYGETAEFFHEHYVIEKAKLPAGVYRSITGNEATALGLLTGAKLAGKDLFYGSYPITPASDILHNLAEYKSHHVVTFQAEDEIAAIGAAIGASYGGAVAATGTSGPGMALKTEAIGLAVMTELPVVIVNVQRGGPSTGLPTKTEQADLLQAVFGRNGECPVPVIAAYSPSDCFQAAIEAVAVAMRYMTPVILLTDGYVGNSTEPWRIPDVKSMPKITVSHPGSADAGTFAPYRRNADGSRPWAIPGTPGLEHRIGGLEKQDVTGAVSHDPENHQRMVRLRADKVANIQPAGEPWLLTGPDSGDLLLVGWGGTGGAIKAATLKLQSEGHRVSACQLRYINPLPAGLEKLLSGFGRVLVPELNLGQLRMVLQMRYQRPFAGYNKIKGQPLTVNEVHDAALAELRPAAPARHA